MATLTWIGLCAVTAVATAVSTAVVRRYALRHAVLDVPNSRSSHDVPTPRGGGIAIVLACVAGWVVVWALGIEGVAPLLVSGAVVAAISAIDDVQGLSAKHRFAAHVAAAALLAVWVGAWPSVALPGLGVVATGRVGIPLALVWIVGMTNAYNFMDGIDGIAGLQAVIAAAGWFALGLLLDLPLVAWTGAVLASSALGFLVHNWSPARIFMGDVGSTFVGFTLAAMSLMATHLAGGEEGARIPLAALLFVWPFVFDASFTFLVRLKRGERVFEAHRSHVYQQAVIAGYSHARVASTYGFLALVSGLCGIAWVVWAETYVAVLGLALVPAALLLVLSLTRLRSRSKST